MNLHTMTTLALACTFLAGCQTLGGLQQDFKTLGNSIGTTLSSAGKSMSASDGTCPSITMDPQLSHLTEFHDMQKTSPESKVSEIAITDIQSECSSDEEGYLTMRIDLHFDGALGAKARRRENDRPFFAYPYFVIVTDEKGTELAREIFAATVTYKSDQEKISLIETLKQRLPLNENGSLPIYKVQVGFQLTEDQLFFNTSEEEL